MSYNMQGKVISLVNDFPDIKFAIEGMFDTAYDDLIHYLTVKPSNYLQWEVG